MLILLPPSEGKRAPSRGRPVDLTSLTLPELESARRQVIDAVVSVAGTPDAAAVLGVPASLHHQIAWDASLPDAPSATAGTVYEGVLYEALDLASLAGGDRRRASSRLRIMSAAYGVLTINDRIAAYRLDPTATLPGLGSVQRHWREHLERVLTRPAGVVVDCRSAPYAAMWRPPQGTPWVHIAVPGASHMAKHTRGLVARALCRHEGRVRSAEQLASVLAETFTVTLHDAPRSGPRVLDVLPA